MKSVLMIPYFFPPEGSAGVYRPLRFVRQLVKLGWDITVVTANPIRYERYDPDLLNQIPRETEVIRVKVNDPWQAIQAWRSKSLEVKLSEVPNEKISQLYAVHHTPFRSKVRDVIQKAETYFYYPDRARPWIRPAIKAIRLACARKHPTVLWATIGPVSAGIVAQQASLHTGIPYVLDFRDPWGLYYAEFENRRPKIIKRLAQRSLYNIFMGAQAVVFLFPKMAECYLRAYKGALDPAKIHIIPNGYEGEIEKFYVPSGDKCNILYTGTLATYRYDTLIQALHKLKLLHPDSAKRLRIIFVGDGMEPLVTAAKSLGVQDLVETALPVPHKELKHFNEKAHAFLILGRHLERKGHELVAGAKLFGYFKAMKPIIGILPNDETKEILASVGVRTIANVDCVLDIMDVLRKICVAWSEGKLASFLPDGDACERFSSESQTLSLIRALQGLPSIEAFVPGKANVPPSLRETIDDESLWYRKL